MLVAEFGISTSRGVAHVQPEGWNHGGNDERRQGALLASMLNTIHEKGCAGGIVFEFMDEWFKATWSVAPLEIPFDRRRLWFNAESPEQSYGLFANRPSAPVRVDGDPSEWTRVAGSSAKGSRGARGWSALRELRVTSDEGYLYVLLSPSYVFSCNAPYAGCEDWWVEIGIAPEAQTPGSVINLNDPDAYTYASYVYPVDLGTTCGYGSGSMSGTLEILSLDGSTLTGRFDGTTTWHEGGYIDVDGDFEAALCP